MKMYRLILLSLIILASCSQEYIQKCYIPAPQAISYIKDKKFQDLKYKGNFSILEANFTKALNDKWGINSEMILLSELGFNAGLIRYHHFNKSYLEVTTGLGYNFRNSIIRSRGLGSFGFILASKYYHHALLTEYFNYYVQPSFLFKFPKNSFIGFSVNTNFVYFNKYIYEYTLENYQGNEERYIYEADDVNLRNIYSLFIEPTLTFKFRNSGKSSFFVQLGYSVCILNYVSHFYLDSRLYNNYPIYEVHDFFFKHPNFRPYIINIGFQFNLQKNNNNTDNQ